MNQQKVMLKSRTGWFAAGRETAVAAERLTDSSFKLFVYICLQADRRTGRLPVETRHWAQVLGKTEEEICAGIAEMQQINACRLLHGCVEISDRFWPYIKTAAAEVGDDVQEYVRQIRALVTEPACVQTSFTPAEEQLAGGLYKRGIRLDLVRRAIWLGCARKYLAMLNGDTYTPITSLRYFIPVVEEVSRLGGQVPDSYWGHVEKKAKSMEKTWVALKSRSA
jgi:hypothetical protein